MFIFFWPLVATNLYGLNQSLIICYLPGPLLASLLDHSLMYSKTQLHVLSLRGGSNSFHFCSHFPWIYPSLVKVFAQAVEFHKILILHRMLIFVASYFILFEVKLLLFIQAFCFLIFK